jgi:hypothetical protein
MNQFIALYIFRGNMETLSCNRNWQLTCHTSVLRTKATCSIHFHMQSSQCSTGSVDLPSRYASLGSRLILHIRSLVDTKSCSTFYQADSKSPDSSLSVLSGVLLLCYRVCHASDLPCAHYHLSVLPSNERSGTLVVQCHPASNREYRVGERTLLISRSGIGRRNLSRR